MSDAIELYVLPSAMEPMFPKDDSGVLNELSTDLISKAGRLKGTANPTTRKAIAEFMRPMNSYYSNLIEGHDTHPLDIDRALRNDFSNDKNKRDLQQEARAHITLHREVCEEAGLINPSSATFLKSIHKRFYDHLSYDFLTVISKEGEKKHVEPGEFRKEEVEVGKHIAPAAKHLDAFVKRFESAYDPADAANKSLIKRIVSIAAAHHRLAWIHPFLDGNGRVVRLHSDASFVREGLDASGMWSISRGLARNNTEYYERLANADMKRHGDLDGRGNLSNKMLVEFCRFFLEVAIDQLDYMYAMLDMENMIRRITSFSDLMVARHAMKPEIRYILIDVFAKGKITKADAMRITNTSDKTLKIMTDQLAAMGLIKSAKEGIEMTYHVNYPLPYSPMFFPGLYPSGKEAEMMLRI
ncbi:MAG: Fic family protein [Flavobacteriales bacterium]